MKILSCILCIILLYGNLLWALSPDSSLDKEKFTSTLHSLIQVLSDLRSSLISPSRVVLLPDTHLRENLELIWDTKAKAFFIYSQSPRSSPGVVYVIQSQGSLPIRDLPQPIGNEVIGGMRVTVYTRTKELDYKIAQALAGSTRFFDPEDKRAIVDFIKDVDLDLARRVLLGVLKEEPIESPQILQLDKSTTINLEEIPHVETIRIDEDTCRLKKGAHSIDIQIITKDKRNFMRIGSRIYERYTGVNTLYIIDLLRDPLTWLGNAELVNFFDAEEIVRLTGTTHSGPPALGPVAWVGDLPGNLAQPAISSKDIENAYHHLEDPGLDPLLKVHYSLLVYLSFSPSELSRGKIPARDLEVISILGENRINEFLYALLGIHDIIIPHIVSIQFRRFYQVLRRLSYIYNIDFISTIPGGLNSAQQDMVVGRIKAIMTRIKDSEIQDFQSIDELNYLTSRLDQPLIFDYDPARKTLVLNLGYLTKERRRKPPPPELYTAPKRGPPGFIDRDKVIVEALGYLVRTHPADVVKVIYQSSRYWGEGWVTYTIFQGLASNYQIAPVFPIKTFKDLRLGVFRPGFGLDGASVETETWIRDMFQKDAFFDNDNIEVMSGSFAPEVNFGERADKNRTIEPLVDAYKYRPLAKAIFGEGELDPELVRRLAIEADIEPGSSDIETLQKVYDYWVEKVKDMFTKWINEKRLNIILGGQIAYPVENPVVYPALTAAVREINSTRPPGDKVLAFARHNYLAQWKLPRTGLRIDIPQAGDGIVIFSESETNNQIFEQILGWRPAMLYEAVRFPWVNESQDKPFQEQIRSDPERTNIGFRDRIVPVRRAGEVLSPLREAFRKRNIPERILYILNASPNLKRMLVKVGGLRYLPQIIDAIEEVSDTVIDSDRILPRLLAMLHEVEKGDPSEYLDIFLKALLENRPGDIPQGVKKLIDRGGMGIIKGELESLDRNSRVGLEYELIEFLSALITANIARHPEIFELNEVLCERKANCLGFAQLFSRLASGFGLKVGFADISAEEGSSYNHIINVVTLSNGRRLNVDLMHGVIGREYKKIRYLRTIEASIYNNRGAALEREGRLEEAKAALETAITLEPENPMAYANLSNIYSKREQFAKAKDTLKTAVRLDPLYYRAWFTLAETCVEMGELDEGILHLGYLIGHGYRHADVYILLGDIYSHLSRLDDALKVYLEGWGVDNNNADLAFLIGISYYRLGRMDKAWEFLQITLSLDKEHPRAGQLLRFIPEIKGEDRLRDALMDDGRVSRGELREIVETAGLVSETAGPRGIPPSGQEKIAGGLASSRIGQAVPPQGIDLPPASPISPVPAEVERYAETSV